jgi:hypothetical protein
MAKQAKQTEAISPAVEAPVTGTVAEVKRPEVVLDSEAIAAQELVVADLTAKLEAAKQTGNDHLIAEAKKKRKGATDKLWRLQNPGGKGGTRSPNGVKSKVAKNPNFIGFTMPEATIAAIEEAVTKFALAGLTREVANGIVLDAALGAVGKFVKPADFAVGLKSTIDKQIEEMLKLQQSLLAG